MSAAAIVVPPGAGRVLRTPSGAGVLVKLSTGETGGALTVFETTRDAGDDRAPRAHRHTNMDETFYVIEGTYVFELDGQPYEAPAGTVVFLPRGTRHRFRSTGTTPGRVLSFASPGGLDRFFEAIAVPGTSLQRAFDDHGFVFDDER